MVPVLVSVSDSREQLGIASRKELPKKLADASGDARAHSRCLVVDFGGKVNYGVLRLADCN